MPVAIVTGSAQGLGSDIARRFVEDGYRVVYADVQGERNRTAADAASSDPDVVMAVDLDVRDLSSVERCLAQALSKWGRLDVWVNNAARTAARPFFEIDPAEWDAVIETNLRGTYFGCRVAGRHMREARRGRIVNVASLAGQWGRSPTGVHYASSKAGIIALTRFAAMELAGDGVTVNAVAPAALEGPSVSAMPQDRIEAYVQTIPVQRLGNGSEVAALVAFLASDMAGFITGATYDINGGILMR